MRSFRWSSARAVFVLTFPLLMVSFSAGAMAQDAPPAQEKPSSTAAAPAPAADPSASPAPQDTLASDDKTDSSLHLGVGDLLEFSVYNVPDLATKTRVGSNGDIYLPLIDYVHVAGLTPEEAQALIEKRYSDGGFLKNPHVSLFISEYASQGASVLGEVSKPGVYPVLGRQRLFDLISAAGGLTEKAGRSITVTHRNQPDKPLTVPLARNVTDNPDSNIDVFPGDTVIVRKADVVYVVGDVGRPSGFLMESGNLTVLQAIALAGGTTRTAKLSGARIIRKGPTGMTDTPLHLKQMLEAKAPDMQMEADDILFVPSSAGKVVASRTLEAALQAATAVSIVAIRP
ncbi:MAG: polysaccharide export protein [Acidobacteriia bacterium]|nr:polysaccharide export protein [Terriglobia bacterium]